MKKHLSLFVVLAALILTACGGGSEAVTEPASAPVETELPAMETSIPKTATLEPTIAPTAAPTEPPAVEPESASVSFANDVMPILQSRCMNCHGGERLEEGLDMTSYTGLMAGSINGVVVIPGDADNSSFIQLVLNNKMPKRGPKLTPAQAQLLIDWVSQGALDN